MVRTERPFWSFSGLKNNMQIDLHASAQEQATGYSDTFTEPNLKARSMVIKISAISVNLLGTVTFKLQHSPDEATWFDVPSMTTTGLSATGTTIVSVDPTFSCFDNLRLAWTFANANSVTFYGAALGDK